QHHCVAPPLTGPCRAAFQRWFHSPEYRDCRPFVYGGCRGNRNNYGSKEECLLRCFLPQNATFLPKI
uniref:BPTI/Kunitz inhibitor domain-containing protein n=1 Tax=Phasianus colchicus TaxID=9054 RepID=A0A669QPU9_PHACC